MIHIGSATQLFLLSFHSNKYTNILQYKWIRRLNINLIKHLRRLVEIKTYRKENCGIEKFL